MDNTVLEALDGYVTQVTSTVSATDVLGIYGKALLAGFSIFLVVWAARKIARTFIRSLNGHIGV